MQNCYKMVNYGKEKVFFCHGVQEISKQISLILPYSKVIMLWIETEYFDFGKDLHHALLSHGIKVYNIIVKDNFCSSKENFLNLEIMAEDCRAVICCNKKLFSFVISENTKIEFGFYIQEGGCLNGLLVPKFFIKDGGVLRLQSRRAQGYIIIDTVKLDQKNVIKDLAVQTLMLLDYVFRLELLGGPIELNFYSKVFALLKSALKKVYSVGEERLLILTELSLSIQQLLCEKQCFYSCACTVLSFLQTGDFFTNDFECAKKIANLYKSSLIKTFYKPVPDYNQDVITLCFLTGLNQKFLLKSALENLNSIASAKEKRIYLTQKRQLLAMFKQLCATLEPQQEKLIVKQTDFDFLSSLAGLTPLGINGITAIYN